MCHGCLGTQHSYAIELATAAMVVSFWYEMQIIVLIIFTNVVVSVEFKKSSYSTSEKNREQVMLVLSNPSSTDITVNIQSNDITATGM